jgi:hypothetical protein
VCLLPPTCYLSIEFAHVLSSLHYAFVSTYLLHICLIEAYFTIVALPTYLLPICLVHAYFIIIVLYICFCLLIACLPCSHMFCHHYLECLFPRAYYMWVHSWLGYQKRVSNLKRTKKDNFRFLFILNVYFAIVTLHACLLSPTRYMSTLFTYLELQVCPLVWYFPPYMLLQEVEYKKHVQPTFC